MTSSTDIPKSIRIDSELAFEMVEILRLAPIYALLNSEFEDEIAEDFKPHKWQGHERDHALKASAAYKALLTAMTEQFDAAESDALSTTRVEGDADAAR